MRLLAVIGILWVMSCGSAIAQQIAPHADSIIIHKKEHLLILMHEDKPLKSYRISIGRGGAGQKIYEGDKKTPEGHYFITGHNAHSHFHRAFRLSYPNPLDRQRALKYGKNPGGDIMIHGLPDGLGWLGKAQLLTDWTAGCIAVTNDAMDELWSFVPDGTAVDIEP